MVATNGHRLAKMEVAVSGHGAQASDLIVMPKALDQVSKLFPDEEDLEVARGDNHLAFKSPFTTIYTRLIEGPYPNYEQVIPKDNDRFADCRQGCAASALRRMATVASDQTHRIKLSFNAGILRFQVNTPDLGDGQDEIPVRYEGDPMDIGFNGAYLLEILKYIPTSEVRLTFKAPERAATVEPEGWSDPATYLTILMPLRLVRLRPERLRTWQRLFQCPELLRQCGAPHVRDTGSREEFWCVARRKASRYQRVSRGFSTPTDAKRHTTSVADLWDTRRRNQRRRLDQPLRHAARLLSVGELKLERLRAAPD